MFTAGQVERMEAALHTARGHRCSPRTAWCRRSGVAVADLWSKDAPTTSAPSRTPSRSRCGSATTSGCATTNDGLDQPGPPEPRVPLAGGAPNYVYVRVRNRGCGQAASATLQLYWAKASRACLARAVGRQRDLSRRSWAGRSDRSPGGRRRRRRRDPRRSPGSRRTPPTTPASAPTRATSACSRGSRPVHAPPFGMTAPEDVEPLRQRPEQQQHRLEEHQVVSGRGAGRRPSRSETSAARSSASRSPWPSPPASGSTARSSASSCGRVDLVAEQLVEPGHREAEDSRTGPLRAGASGRAARAVRAHRRPALHGRRRGGSRSARRRARGDGDRARRRSSTSSEAQAGAARRPAARLQAARPPAAAAAQSRGRSATGSTPTRRTSPAWRCGGRRASSCRPRAGRRELLLGDDGSAVFGEIAPTAGLRSLDGFWHAEGDARIVLDFADPDLRRRVLEIAGLEPDALRIVRS